jgi:hypothetical protein
MRKRGKGGESQNREREREKTGDWHPHLQFVINAL